MDCGVGRIDVREADVDEHVEDEEEHEDEGESLKRFDRVCCCCC